jgi:tyrosine-protein kinase Etk/Wzc
MENESTKAPERTLLEAALHAGAILLRHRWLIIITTAAALVLAAGFAVLSIRLPPDVSPLPNTYKAVSTLLIQQASGTGDLGATIMAALGVEQKTIDAASGFDAGALVLLILRSRTIIDQVSAEFGLATRYRITENVKSKTRAHVLASLRCDYARNTGSITVSYEDVDPALARDLVNRLVALTDLWFSQNRGYAKKQQMQLLEQKIGDVKQEIGTLEDRLKVLQKKYGVLTAQDLGTSQAAAIADLRSQLILKEIEIRNYSDFSVVDDPHLQQLNQERQNILDLIQQMQKGLPETPASTSASQDLSLPDVAQEFSALTLELDIQRRIYNTLSPQYEAAKLTTESAPVFDVLETADIPDMKAGPQRSKLVAEAGAGGLVVSVLLAFLLNAVSRARSSAAGRKQ